MNYQALIEQCGVHSSLGPGGNDWGIEQNPEELAMFLAAIPPVSTVLEIGTGHKAGLARFMHEHLGWDVTSVDIQDYGHKSIPGCNFIISDKRLDFDHTYDLVIIDGDHGYTPVLMDYVHYGDYAKKVLMFHDICGLRGCEGAMNFWYALARNGLILKAHFYEAIAKGDRRVGIGWRINDQHFDPALARAE